MTKMLMLPAAGAILLGLAACNPYNPADRAFGGAAPTRVRRSAAGLVRLSAPVLALASVRRPAS